ncbi:ATP-binding protein [Streptomyces sp. Tue6028]|uniref:ATP-binding protein n=1 Tax=Streptomyces sp. Tue6028 TaxID=2036037 RepID=UPI000BB33C44|nr:ATP-binding protein [Streptomyces sp. Tue6028]PBC65478.1 ATP-binding protein [Streptomyces sp. Tue6028]
MALQLNTMLPETLEHVCPLPPVPGAVPALRRQVGTVLAEWNIDPAIVDDCLLVVSELLTNAIMHALPPAELRLSWSRGCGLDTLHIEVSDAGPARPPGQRQAGSDPDEHGRGEEIVHALAARHGMRVHQGRIARWAELVAV